MTNPSFLNVKSVEIRQDKNKRSYSYIVVAGEEQEHFTLPTGKVIVARKPAQQSAFIAYEENYLGNQDFGWDVKPKDVLMGAIVSRTVTPYEITGSDGTVRTVNTYKTVVLGDTRDEASFEVAVRAAFKNAGHNLDYTEAVALVQEAPALMGN